MPALQNNGGDVLARGGVRATFRPMGENLSKEKWEKMFRGKPEPVVKAVYLFKCPVHGVFESDREFFVSGGYPLVNEYAKGKCPLSDCGEEASYAGQKALPVEGSGSDASIPAGASSSKPGSARKRSRKIYKDVS